MEEYGKNTNICEIDRPGDSFYIVIKGEVGVLSHNFHNDSYDNYFELYRIMTKIDKWLIKVDDVHSKIVKTFIDLIPQPERKRLNFQSIDEMDAFVYEMFAHLNTDEESRVIELFGMTNKHSVKSIKALKNNTKFLYDFHKQLKLQQAKKIAPF